MPGTKRKASFATPYERPAKLNKRSTSSTVSDSRKSKSSKAAPRRPELLKLRSAKKGTVEVAATSPKSASSSSSGELGSPTPSLRRASTLTLEDEAKSSPTRTLSKRSSSKSSKGAEPSLTRKSSSVVDAGNLITTLSGLKSGSIIGRTTSVTESPITKEPSLSKSLSRKSLKSAAKDKVSIPTGLTKLALSASGSKSSLRVSKSSLVDTIGDSEMSTALASLRRELSTGKETTTESTDKSKDAMEEGETGGEDGAALTEEAGVSGEALGMLPPAGLVEVAISFDTTGSMYGCLKEVRAKIKDLVQRLQADIPGIRICVIAHGDYCDAAKYIVKWIDFGASLPEICKFVTDVEATFGGDGPECYELVLKRARETLAWTPGSQRVLIMIGDDEPHPVGYSYNRQTYNIDWREECALLKEMNVKIYGVQAGDNHNSEMFFKEMASMTGGTHLPLAGFTSIFDFLMMICYREGNPDMMPAYQDEVRARHAGGMAKDMADLVMTFGGTGPDTTAAAKAIPLKAKKPTKAAKATKAAKIPKAAKVPTTAKAAKVPKATKAAKVPKAVKAAKAPKATKAAKVPKAAKAAKEPKAAKTAKAAKAPKAAPKRGKKRTPKKKDAKKLPRENMNDSKLIGGALKKLKWSSWEPLITQENMVGKDLKKCKHNFGYRRRALFKSDSKIPAIYEIAVQLPGKKKKFAMYFRKSVGFTLKTRWDVYLLRSKSVKAEVEALFTKGCNFFCRRGVPTAKARNGQLKQIWAANVYLRTTIDYAWRKYLYGKKKHRKVVRSKIQISSDTI